YTTGPPPLTPPRHGCPGERASGPQAPRSGPLLTGPLRQLYLKPVQKFAPTVRLHEPTRALPIAVRIIVAEKAVHRHRRSHRRRMGLRGTKCVRGGRLVSTQFTH